MATQIFKEGDLQLSPSVHPSKHHGRLATACRLCRVKVSSAVLLKLTARTTQVLERPTPIEVDSGLLAAFDTVPIDEEEYQ